MQGATDEFVERPCFRDVHQFRWATRWLPFNENKPVGMAKTTAFNRILYLYITVTGWEVKTRSSRSILALPTAYSWDIIFFFRPSQLAGAFWMLPINRRGARGDHSDSGPRIGFLLESSSFPGFPRIFFKVTSRSTWTSQVSRAPCQPL